MEKQITYKHLKKVRKVVLLQRQMSGSPAIYDILWELSGKTDQQNILLPVMPC